LNSFGSVESLAANKFWRLRRNFFLDSPFIEPSHLKLNQYRKTG